jgi:MFS family permease
MSLLRDRNFLLLFVGQGVSRFGDGLYAAATAWLAWSLAKDPTAVAVVSVSAFTPAFVSASYADRYDRRKLMIATGLASALTDIPLIALVQRPYRATIWRRRWVCGRPVWQEPWPFPPSWPRPPSHSPESRTPSSSRAPPSSISS